MSPSVGGLALTCSQPGTQLVCAKERAVEQAVNLQAWGRSMGPCLTFSESSVTAHLHKGTLNDSEHFSSRNLPRGKGSQENGHVGSTVP